ncbi:MAG: hypothetical protein PUE00_13570 [Thermobifida fusca]|nr:hypothetical protein [Thermobifida fusca]
MKKQSRPRSLSLLATGLLTTALVLAMPSAHAQDSIETAPSSEDLPSIGSTTATHSAWEGARIEINELKRSATGQYTSLVWTLYNNSKTEIWLHEFKNSVYSYPSGASGNGLVLIDEERGIRFNTYIDSEKGCLCAGADHNVVSFVLRTDPGGKSTYWASYQIPEETKKVTIEIPGFHPVKDVPIS